MVSDVNRNHNVYGGNNNNNNNNNDDTIKTIDFKVINIKFDIDSM